MPCFPDLDVCYCPLAGTTTPASPDLCQSAQEALGTWDGPCEGCPCWCHVPLTAEAPEGCRGCGASGAVCGCSGEALSAGRTCEPVAKPLQGCEAGLASACSMMPHAPDLVLCPACHEVTEPVGDRP